jgi:dihydrofolate reductase
MRKIIISEMVTVDGLFEGENHDIDWHSVDDDFNNYAIELTERADTLLFGRVTYDLFESFWPRALKDPNTSEDDKKIAQFIWDAKKVVFSRTRTMAAWNNSVIIKDNLKEEVQKLKEEEGKDILIYGSGTIVSQLSDLGLIDEYILFVSPIILGRGTPLFKDATKRQKLKIKEVKEFSNGNVILNYVK